MSDDEIKTPANLSKLLDDARPALAQLDASTLAQRKISRGRVRELTGVLLPSFAAIDEQLDVELNDERAATRRKEAAGLDLRAWVCFAADLEADGVFADTVKQRRDALAVRVAAHDRTLFKWAKPLFEDDHAETLADIQRNNGRRDAAEDVLRLVKLFRDNWAAAAGKSGITQAYLDEAALDATTLLDLLRPSKLNPARDLAARAYTAWATDYNQLMELGRYLTRDEADSATRFPGIHSVSGRASAPAVKDGAAVEGGAAVEDGAVVPDDG